MGYRFGVLASQREPVGEQGEESMKERVARIGTIFLVMAKIGCFTFGGGWSIIAQMQVEFVEKRQMMTQEQLVDFMSLSRSFPGIMIINMAVMFGYTAEGVAGALAAAFGLSFPALIAIGIVTYFYTKLHNNIYVLKILNGVRSAVIPIIISAAFKLKGKALTSKTGFVIMCIALVLCAFSPINKVYIVVLGATSGLLIWRGGRTDALS